MDRMQATLLLYGYLVRDRVYSKFVFNEFWAVRLWEIATNQVALWCAGDRNETISPLTHHVLTGVEIKDGRVIPNEQTKTDSG